MIDVDFEQSHGDFVLRAKFSTEAPVVGLFGRSGAGKTSLVNAIAGVTSPRRGHIRIDGVTLFDSAQRIDVPMQKRRVGYVFQEALLFPHLTVGANLSYGLRLRPASARYIEPGRVIDVLGLRAMVDRKPATLSGGERQRVAIGRALLAQPRLLLLDEPLASLDVPRRTEILDYVERLRDEFHVPIVYVSHSVPEITRLADTVVILSEGECLAAGAVDDVMGRLDLKPHTGRYEAGAVIEAMVAAQDEQFQLTTLQFAGGELTVPRVDAKAGERVRARVRARDVSLATARPEGLSILNVLHARIVAIAVETGAVVDLELAVGEARLLARVTRRSCAELGLREGQEVFALIKAVSFDQRSTGYA
ncbi:MAG: molybdenum ABC transporter ATP-binding protein [Casimicrobiaceae bacterium]